MSLDILVDDITNLMRSKPSCKWPSAIKMSTAAQGKLINIEATEGRVPMHLPANNTVSSICGIPIMTDDSLGEDEVILVYGEMRIVL